MTDIWTVLTAIATVAAVLVALGASWWTRRQEIAQAKIFLPAINDELRWVADTAALVGDAVRGYMDNVQQHKKPPPGSPPMFFSPAFNSDELAVLLAYDFPVFFGFKEFVGRGPRDTAADVVSAYGHLLRAQSLLRHGFEEWRDGHHPEDMLTCRSAAEEMMATARSAYCVVGMRTGQQMPEAWKPSSERNVAE